MVTIIQILTAFRVRLLVSIGLIICIRPVAMVIAALVSVLILTQHLQTVDVEPLLQNSFYLLAFLFLFPLNKRLSLAKLFNGHFIACLLLAIATVTILI